jgi:hypothetical protein
MEAKHTDYFLRRITNNDSDKSFQTIREAFNTPSRSLKEYVKEDRDCNDDGVFITYIFGEEETIYGVARMKPLSFADFKQEILEKEIFDSPIIEEYVNLQVLYMSRVGVSKEVEGLGFGVMLRSFLDGHARTIYKNFLLYAYINESMIDSMIRTFGEKEFFKRYRVSKQLYDEKWKNYWVILREFKSN